jgi:hypothetical protein
MADNQNIEINIGTCLFVAVGAPATYDKVGFDALTWIEVGEVTDFGEVGGERSVSTHIPVKTGEVNKRGGSIDYGQQAVTFGKDLTDVGQIALEAAVDDNTTHSVKVLDSDGVNYEAYTAIVTSFKTSRGDASTIIGGSSNFDLTGKPTYFAVA